MALAASAATISPIVDLVKTGRCILFAGAGVHLPPPAHFTHTFGGAPYSYAEPERPPLGGALSEDIARAGQYAVDFPTGNPRDLQRVAMHYELNKSRIELVGKIREAVETGKKPSPIVRALARLNFPLVCTTNYDGLLETAFYAAGKRPLTSIYSKERGKAHDYPLPEPDPQQPFIFKIHGDIGKPESIVITDEDYIDFVLRMNDVDEWYPVPITLNYYIRKWPILFIGYSLTDYNLRLLFKTLRWRGDRAGIPRSYSVDLYPDFLIRKFYDEQNRFIQYIVLDVWDFVYDLYYAVTGEQMPL